MESVNPTDLEREQGILTFVEEERPINRNSIAYSAVVEEIEKVRNAVMRSSLRNMLSRSVKR